MISSISDAWSDLRMPTSRSPFLPMNRKEKGAIDRFWNSSSTSTLEVILRTRNSTGREMRISVFWWTILRPSTNDFEATESVSGRRRRK